MANGTGMEKTNFYFSIVSVKMGIASSDRDTRGWIANRTPHSSV